MGLLLHLGPSCITPHHFNVIQPQILLCSWKDVRTKFSEEREMLMKYWRMVPFYVILILEIKLERQKKKKKEMICLPLAALRLTLGISVRSPTLELERESGMGCRW
jgi:hypothetical protein